MKNIFRYPSIIVVLCLGIIGVMIVLYSWQLFPFNSRVESTDNAYVRGNVTLLSPQVSGYITQVKVQDFVQVEKGDVLFVIDDSTYRQELLQAEAAAAQSQVTLQNFEQNRASSAASLQLAEAELQSAQATQSKAALDTGRNGPLLEKGLVSKTTGDELHTALLTAQANVAKARASVNIARQDLALVDASKASLAAALKGVREVGFTVLSMSLSLIAVFLPLLMIGGLIGRFFSEFAITLSVAIVISLFISVTLTPVMCAYLLKPHAPRSQPRQRGAGRLLMAIQQGYGRSLSVVLNHARWVMVLFFATIVLTGWLFVHIPKTFMPEQDTGRLSGFISADQSISFQAMRSKLQDFMEIVGADPAVESVVGFTGGMRTNSGSMFISLKPLSERKESAVEIIARLRNKLAKEPGASLYLNAVQDLRVGGRESNAGYQYSLLSDDLKALR